MKRTTRRSVLVICATMAAALLALAQSPLVPAAAREVTILRGQPYSLPIPADKDQVLWIEIDPRDIAFSVEVQAPDGAELLRIQDLNGLFGSQTFGFVVKTGGDQKLTLIPAEDSAGSCTLRLRERRAASAADTARLAVQKDLLEGIRLFRQATAQSILPALVLFDGARKRAHELGDPNAEAQAMYWAAPMTLAMGGMKAVHESLDQAAKLWRSTGNERAAAEAVNQQAILAMSQNQFDSALGSFESALALRKQLNDRRGEAASQEGICSMLLVRGDPAAAIPHCQASLAIRQALGDRSGQASTLNYIALAYGALGENRLGAETMQNAIAVLRTSGSAQLERIFLLHLGKLYSNLGEFQEALNYTESALEAAKKAGDPITQGAALSNLGSIYVGLGEHDRALEYLNQALPLKRSIGDKRAEAATLLNIGWVLLAKREYRQAVERFQTALPLLQKTGGREGEANALNDLGDAFVGLREFDTALDYYRKALAIRQEIGDQRGEAYTHNGFGETYLQLKRYADGLDHYQRALGLFHAAGDRNGELGAFYGMARTQAAEGHLDTAAVTISSALDLLETARAQIVVPEIRTSYFAQRHEYYEFAVDNLMRLHVLHPDAGYALHALETHERAQARGLIDLLTESGVDSDKGMPSELQLRERNARELLKSTLERRLQSLTSKDGGKALADLDRQVQERTRAYEQVEEAIRSKSPEYAALVHPAPVTSAQIQQELGDSQTALLEYALGAERSYLWVVTRTAVESFELPARSEIELAARRFYMLVSNRPDAATKDGDETAKVAASLGRMLLGPARPAIQGKRLVIVPDGVLCYIPFEALTDPASAGQIAPLIAGHRVSSLPAASVLPGLRRQTTRRTPAPKLLALFGDPVFDKADSRIKPGTTAAQPQATCSAETNESPERAPVGFSLGRLVFSRREVDEIHSLFPVRQSVELLDFAANLEAVTSTEMGRYRIIHLATHGILDSEHPERSALVLSLVNEHGQTRRGFLKTPDILSLDLRAELVVLSACQSALGREINGEGLVGLTRAFFYAGARRVVASLWKVDDLATAELMKAFYRRLTAGESATAALQGAKIEISKRPAWASPYYWAAFELQGEFDGSPVSRGTR